MTSQGNLGNNDKDHCNPPKKYGIVFTKLNEPIEEEREENQSPSWCNFHVVANCGTRNKLIAGGNIAQVSLYSENDHHNYDHAGFLELDNAKPELSSFPNNHPPDKALLYVEVKSETEIPKDYTGIVIAAIKTTNKEKMKLYNPSKSIADYRGVLLFRSYELPTITPYDFVVALAFPSGKVAYNWMCSKEYDEMKRLRLQNSVGPLFILDTDSTVEMSLRNRKVLNNV